MKPKHTLYFLSFLSYLFISSYLLADFQDKFIENQLLEFQANVDACENKGDQDACGSVGLQLQDGIYSEKFGWLIKKDIAYANKLILNACLIGNKMFFCYKIGTMFQKGENVPKRLSLAKTFFEKVCDSEDRVRNLGCDRLGRMYIEGEGVPKNFETAKEYFIKTCDAMFEDTACTNSAWFFLDGIGGLPKDIPTFIRMKDMLCARGRSEECYSLGLFYDNQYAHKNKDWAPYLDHLKALDYYSQACKGNYKEACNIK